tara:strand:+ start:6898 stop:8097 length:1200 start_codon:yes stop_codon:yes gene_type:complete
MPTCPQGPNDDPNNKYHYKIYIQYNIRKYMPSDIYHNFTGDEVPVWSPDKNARNSMFSVYKSKQEQKEDWFQKGDTVVYHDKEHPNNLKKAKITNILKPKSTSAAYKDSLENKTTYVKPPTFPPEYTLTFENPTELPGQEPIKTIKIKGKDVKKLKKEGNSITHLCLPVKGKRITNSYFRPHAERIIKKGFLKGQEFLPLAIHARFTKQKRLNSWDLVPPDKDQKFKIRDVELVDIAAIDAGKRRKITLRVKLSLDIEGGDGASIMDKMGYKLQNFTATFDCQSNREKLQENINKIGKRQTGGKPRTRKKRRRSTGRSGKKNKTRKTATVHKFQIVKKNPLTIKIYERHGKKWKLIETTVVQKGGKWAKKYKKSIKYGKKRTKRRKGKRRRTRRKRYRK